MPSSRRALGLTGKLSGLTSCWPQNTLDKLGSLQGTEGSTARARAVLFCVAVFFALPLIFPNAYSSAAAGSASAYEAALSP